MTHLPDAGGFDTYDTPPLVKARDDECGVPNDSRAHALDERERGNPSSLLWRKRQD
jgi:hypothetical protein